ncbi:MAG: DUF4956 domain-containing protein [Ruminococcaceae bacterium]|nr:DUF4956 domain-containing protein [Oscillospiraceae bacterium]
MLFDLIAELFATSPTSSADALANMLVTGQSSAVASHPFLAFIVIAVFCCLFGGVAAAVYGFTKRDEPLSWNFMIAIALLPGIIAMLVYLTRDSFIGVLSMAGIFTMVRFRSIAADPKDLACVVFTMAIGLAGGSKLLAYAAAATGVFVIFLVVAYLIGLTRQTTRSRCKLKITVPENMCWDKTFEDVLKTYTRRATLARVKTIELGSFFELMYDITLKQGADEKAMIDEIRTRNGNLTVLLNKRPDSTYDPM